MSSTDRSVVTDRGNVQRADLRRIDASSQAHALAALSDHDDPSTVCAVVDDAMDHDELVALVSVLVMGGVAAFETAHRHVVQRIIDTHSAIRHGQLEVLEQ